MADDLMSGRAIRVELATTPSESDVQALSQGIIVFNRQRVPDLEEVENEIRFHVLVRSRSDDGNILGGLRGACFWNTLHVELLWLGDTARGQGVGQRVLAEAERYAASLGMRNALVETTSWQARPFYEKQGYACIATIPDRPAGHTTFHLLKRMDAGAAPDAAP